MSTVSRRGFLRSAGMGALTAASAGVFGRYSTRWLECNEYELALPRWTRNGFRVAFLSDSHLTDDAAVNVTREALEYAIAQRPDLIVYGGDFVEESRKIALTRMADAFAPLRSSGIPAVTVLGNHDYAVAKPDHVHQMATSLGFAVLCNQAVEVAGITVVGLDCLTFGRCRPGVINQLMARQNILAVLHEPDGVDLIESKPSLMLSGHSHGGQICLPTGYPISTPNGARKYRKGFYPDGPVPIFVSRGLGETGIRLRLFCRPEASILHLMSAGNA